MAFEPPDNVRNFFVWIWEVLFGKEEYIIKSLEECQEVKDIYGPNRPLKK